MLFFSKFGCRGSNEFFCLLEKCDNFSKDIGKFFKIGFILYHFNKCLKQLVNQYNLNENTHKKLFYNAQSYIECIVKPSIILSTSKLIPQSIYILKFLASSSNIYIFYLFINVAFFSLKQKLKIQLMHNSIFYISYVINYKSQSL